MDVQVTCHHMLLDSPKPPNNPVSPKKEYATSPKQYATKLHAEVDLCKAITIYLSLESNHCGCKYDFSTCIVPLQNPIPGDRPATQPFSVQWGIGFLGFGRSVEQWTMVCHGTVGYILPNGAMDWNNGHNSLKYGGIRALRRDSNPCAKGQGGMRYSAIAQ